MSSLRNSLHRRNHKERSQLAHRSRLGLLEKHKDYVLRARDYHSKQDRITRLRHKAADRNKDEFYFGMNNQRTEGGVHVQERGNASLPVDIVKVLKSQDENYIRTKRTAGLKKIENLKNRLTALADLVKPVDEDDEQELDETEVAILREAGIFPPAQPSKRRQKSHRSGAKHIVFAGDEDEARNYVAPPRHTAVEEKMDVDEDEQLDLGWKRAEKDSKKKGKEKAHDSQQLVDPKDTEAAVQLRTQLLKELSARLSRDKQLRYAERELEMQKLLMGKGASKKQQGVEQIVEDEDEDEDSDGDRRPKKVDEKTWKPRVYKWKLERKR